MSALDPSRRRRSSLAAPVSHDRAAQAHLGELQTLLCHVPSCEGVGRYRFVRSIASGGMGDILLAHPTGSPHTPVAVKVLKPIQSDRELARKLLVREAELAARVHHRNVCKVIGYGNEGDRFYLVMEYLEGITLGGLLRNLAGHRRRLPLIDVLGIMHQLCLGVGALHATHTGIIHRDISPGNAILTESGVVKLIDFGISKSDWSGDYTKTGTIKGKWRYMSPEQARGRALDVRSDVFSLGIVMWELLTCRALFRRPTDMETFHAITEEPIPTVSKHRTVPDPIQDVLDRSLARRPEERFKSAGEFAAVLERICPIPVASPARIARLLPTRSDEPVPV